MAYILDPFQRIIGLGGYSNIIYKRAGATTVCTWPLSGVSNAFETVKRRSNLNPPYDYTDTVIDSEPLNTCQLTGNGTFYLGLDQGDLGSQDPVLGSYTPYIVGKFNIGAAKWYASGQPVPNIYFSQSHNVGMYPKTSVFYTSNPSIPAYIDTKFNGSLIATRTRSAINFNRTTLPYTPFPYDEFAVILSSLKLHEAPASNYWPPGTLGVYNNAGDPAPQTTISFSEGQVCTFEVTLRIPALGVSETHSIDHTWV